MMDPVIRSVIVLGGGSAGFLAALTLQHRVPGLKVTVVRARDIPVIGVGEATTSWFSIYLHNILGLDRQRFHEKVCPVWKLGVKLIWGPRDQKAFYYPFGGQYLEASIGGLPRENAFYCLARGLQPASLYYALMETERSPMHRLPDGSVGLDERYGYHIENRTFISYLEMIATERGIDIQERHVEGAIKREDGGIKALRFKDGSTMEADFFVDCSGFGSRLLGVEMAEPYESFSDSLFCDMALAGVWEREAPVLPYTTAETMDHGWCWRTEFEHHVNRGYVFSSRFCDVERAERELRRKNPQISEKLNVVKFKTGRHRRMWVKNVAAVGNASGFVEPLEATGLQMIGVESLTVAGVIRDSAGRPTEGMIRLANNQINTWWDDIRGFLALHFKFNERLNTPFWRACRAETNLAGASDFVKFYQESGPSAMCQSLVPRYTVFGHGGYLAMLLGMRVPTKFQPRFEPGELEAFDAVVQRIRATAQEAMEMEEAIARTHRADWRW